MLTSMHAVRRHAIGVAAIVLACTSAPPPQLPRTVPVVLAPAATAPFTKRLEFAVLEDYDVNADLGEVARDFALLRELGVRTWRGSFGWDDYEPVPGRFDFAWLTRFVALAQRDGIALRPYLGYTPAWAAIGRTGDGQVWNDPPRDPERWYAFVRTLVAALRPYPNVRSYEIYNEVNVRLWWDGTVAEYNQVLARGSAAVRAADPDAEVLLGGLVWPDVEWMEATCETYGNASSIDVVPFHAYPETWTPESVTVERYLDVHYRDAFVPLVDGACGGKPIWINETGYATTPGRGERQQADWWARALATFAADRRVAHVGIYEIKDLPRTSAVIGDAPNYHLGLTRVDRTPKLAFHTVRTLVRLLSADSLTVADAELAAVVTAGTPGELHGHLFRRPDGVQVLVVWDRTGSPTLDLRLRRPGTTAVAWGLDGTARPHASFDGRVLADVRVTAGEARIFEIRP
ncbi:MAG TPA: beta-galactosidase [Gemmatimonadaceae bacterium]|nr:beta-galactosidase [Gemmatimonadaceae bacterium]